MPAITVFVTVLSAAKADCTCPRAGAHWQCSVLLLSTAFLCCAHCHRR